MSENNGGTWVPAEMFKTWESLRLDSPSAWNVLMVVANQQYRYCGTKAHVTLREASERTKLSYSTVKRAVTRLRKEGLLSKVSQGRWQLTGLNMVSHPERSKRECKGLIIMNHSMGHPHEPFSILLFSLMKEGNNNAEKMPFTSKQMSMLNSVYRQISELLCGDPMKLTVPNSDGNAAAKTYGDWLRGIVETRSRKDAGLSAGAMLKLLKDERVAGKELK